MENIVIKMNKEFYSRDGDIEYIMKYIAGLTEGKEKTRYCGGRGLPRDPQKAKECIVNIQRYYRKKKQRRLYHLMVSFPSTEEDVNYVKMVAENVANKFFEKHQVYYGIHEDTDNLHIHFAINAVSYVDGKKWHQSNKEFDEMKKDIQKCADRLKVLYG